MFVLSGQTRIRFGVCVSIERYFNCQGYMGVANSGVVGGECGVQMIFVRGTIRNLNLGHSNLQFMSRGFTLVDLLPTANYVEFEVHPSS